MKKPEDFGITKYDKEKFEKTGILDCFQSVDLRYRNLEKIPFQFGIVDGCFDCAYNKLKSLYGCPLEVRGFFKCSYNLLESLEGCPQEVHGIFHCSFNKLESLEFCPKEVDGDFYCSHNKIKSLKGISQKIKGYLNCYGNSFDMTVQEWLHYLEKYQKNGLYRSCRIVSDNSTYESTLKGLKDKLAILEALK